MSAPANLVYTQGTGAPPVSADNLNTFVQWAMNVAAMRSFSGLPLMTVFMQGTVTVNDGGQGDFYWNTVTGTDDNGVTTIVPNGSTGGCWTRVATGSSAVSAPGFTVTGSTIPTNGIYLPSANNVGLAANSALQVDIGGTASAVNYIKLTGAISGSGPTASVLGTDANVPFNFTSQGTGALNFNTGGGQQFQVANTASAVNYGVMTGAVTGSGPTLSVAGSDTNIAMNLNSKGTGAINHNTGGGLQFQVANIVNAANYWTLAGSQSGNSLTLTATGSDSNIPISFNTKGTSSFQFNTNGGLQPEFSIFHINNSVNYLGVNGAATGSGPILNATGSDSNVDILLQPKGSGNVQFNTTGSFSANASVATALSSIGPVGSHTTVQEWLTIKNSAGVVRYIPCF